MAFDLNKCVNYISDNTIKKISEAFSKWVSDYGITRIQWIALYYLHVNGNISQRDLSKYMKITDSSAMRLIDRLEKSQLILRCRSKEDKRIILISLTEQGNKLITELLPMGLEFNMLLTKDISDEELNIFQNVMGKMLENVMSDNRSK